MSTKVQYVDYQFRFRETAGVRQVFDPVRKKYVTLTPEEWVRQHILHNLIDMGYPPALIAVERGISVNKESRRFDIVVYDRESQPLILVECKSQNEKIDMRTFMQLSAYNLSLNGSYFWLTNGELHYFIRLSDGNVMAEVPRAETLYSLK